jgi:hypothetical protein
MDTEAFRKQLAEPRADVAAAVAEDVRRHVAALRARGVDFYGYAVLPGVEDEILDLVAVVNTEADIPLPPTDKSYLHYRYEADEWQHWEYDAFPTANRLIAEANERFRAMYPDAGYDEETYALEVALAESLLESVVRGLEAARNGGAFGDEPPYMVVWFTDSNHRIAGESLVRLNAAEVAAEARHLFP